MSIAAGSARAGRSSRVGSSRPGLLGQGVAAARGLAGRARGRRGRMAGGRRHRRGITSTELRGFRKIVRLLRSVGMRPKGTGHGHIKRSGP